MKKEEHHYLFLYDLPTARSGTFFISSRSTKLSKVGGCVVLCCVVPNDSDRKGRHRCSWSVCVCAHANVLECE